MDPDGGAPTQLTHGDTVYFAPAWSPDGSRIAFSSSQDGKLSILVSKADGSLRTPLTDRPFSGPSPGRSPDGRTLALEPNRPNNRESDTMSASGSQQVLMRRQPARHAS